MCKFRRHGQRPQATLCSAVMDPHIRRTFVGVCDEQIPLSYATTWQLNKLGGFPDWMYPNCSYPSCNACGDPMYHVTQMYCPLAASQYHRTLYIFTCVGKSCINNRESWRAFRSQLLVLQSTGSKQVTQEATTMVAMAMDEWCKDADDWGNELEEESTDKQVGPSPSNDTHDRGGAKPSMGCHLSGNTVNIATQSLRNASSNDDIPTRATAKIARGQDFDVDTVQEQLEDVDQSQDMTRLSISTPNTQLSSKDSESVWSRSQRLSFKCCFVSVFDEPSPSVTELTNHERELIADYQQREGVDLLQWQTEHLQTMRRVSSCEETYEKTSAKHGDNVFQRFAKRLQICPEQCIRYSWNASPLYMTSSEGALIPPCQYCGSDRVFEVQLMPQLINTLHDPDRPDLQIDFGVVIVYTCKVSCWDTPSQSSQPNLREEYIELQIDPDSSSLIGQSQH